MRTCRYCRAEVKPPQPCSCPAAQAEADRIMHPSWLGDVLARAQATAAAGPAPMRNGRVRHGS